MIALDNSIYIGRTQHVGLLEVVLTPKLLTPWEGGSGNWLVFCNPYLPQWGPLVFVISCRQEEICHFETYEIKAFARTTLTILTLDITTLYICGKCKANMQCLVNLHTALQHAHYFRRRRRHWQSGGWESEMSSPFLRKHRQPKLRIWGFHARTDFFFEAGNFYILCLLFSIYALYCLLAVNHVSVCPR